jgi:hypothetical protein
MLTLDIKVTESLTTASPITIFKVYTAGSVFYYDLTDDFAKIICLKTSGASPCTTAMSFDLVTYDVNTPQHNLYIGSVFSLDLTGPPYLVTDTNHG